jgi:hypothetical protein
MGGTGLTVALLGVSLLMIRSLCLKG